MLYIRLKVKKDCINKSNKKCIQIKYLFVDIDNVDKTWGHPVKFQSSSKKINYSNQIIKINDHNIDFILIDGRFRVACCLKCFDQISEKCVIAFDDFIPRKQYHIILDYYQVIDKTNSMVMLKKRNNVNSPTEGIINKYNLIAD